jgi:hypothetical protein
MRKPEATGNGAKDRGNEKKLDVENVDDRLRQFQRLYRATLRGAAIGLLLRGGLHGVGVLARVAKGQSTGGLHARFLDTMRWACTLGCFSAVYVGADEAIRSLVGCSRCEASTLLRSIL